MREKIEYWLVVAVARALGRMPRGLARLLAGAIAWAVYLLFGRLRRVGERNLELALPEAHSRQRDERSCAASIAISAGNWSSSAACRATRAKNIEGWIRTEGLEHYLAARDRGKGVLVLTGHLGAWELSSFYHSLMGYPDGDGDPAAR